MDADLSSSQQCYLDWTYDQKKLISIAPRIPCVLSIIGSGYIICNIINENKWSSSLCNRLMFGMSVCDMIGSFAQFFTTLPMPADAVVDGGPSIDKCYFGNLGNATACELQGFLIHSFTIAVPIYNASLCIFYLLYVRHDWDEQRLRKIEPLMHGFALYPMITAILIWNNGLFNPGVTFCWIARYPLGCSQDGEVECVRGESTFITRWLAVAAPLAVSFITIIITMALLCLFVYQQDARIAAFRPEDQRNYECSRKVFWRACRYVGAYLLVWLPTIAYVVNSSSFGYDGFEFALFVFLIVPLQGALNAMIFSEDCLSCWYCRRSISRIFGISASDDDSVFDADVSVATAVETACVSAASA